MTLKPIASEKAVKLIDLKNTLLFETERTKTKPEICSELEKTFEVKISSIKTLIRKNKKYAYVKLKKEYPAINIATKLGMI